MFRPFIGTCVNPQCRRKNVPIPVKSGICDKCNYEQKQAKKKASGKRSGGYQHKPKPTGEKALFEAILAVRGKKSQISGKPLFGEFNPSWFSHVLAKSVYKKFRLYDKNIVIKTPEEHELWQNHKDKIKDDPKWKWVFDLAEELKQEYNNPPSQICD